MQFKLQKSFRNRRTRWTRAGVTRQLATHCSPSWVLRTPYFWFLQEVPWFLPLACSGRTDCLTVWEDWLTDWLSKLGVVSFSTPSPVLSAVSLCLWRVCVRVCPRACACSGIPLSPPVWLNFSPNCVSLVLFWGPQVSAVALWYLPWGHGSPAPFCRAFPLLPQCLGEAWQLAKPRLGERVDKVGTERGSFKSGPNFL